jgi:hypothetical protein
MRPVRFFVDCALDLRIALAEVLVMGCGGFLGPILIIYGIHDLGQLIAGLTVTVLSQVVVWGLVRVTVRADAQVAALKRDGMMVVAVITSAVEHESDQHVEPNVRLGLRVEGPSFAFDTTADVRGDRDHMPSIDARRVVVLVDPSAQRCHLDWDRSAIMNGPARARFTVTDDGRTYDLTGQAEALVHVLEILRAHGFPPRDWNEAARANPTVRRQLAEVVLTSTRPARGPDAANAARPDR